MLTSTSSAAVCHALIRELDLWQTKALVARVWWRDDDAKSSNDAFSRLMDIAEQAGIPLILAVSPGLAEDAFLLRVGGITNVSFAAHGYRHVNHNKGSRKAEFGPDRPVDEMRQEIEELAGKFISEFPKRALAIFVPPWHVLDPRLVPDLLRVGFQVISMQHRRVLRILYRAAANMPAPNFAYPRPWSERTLEAGIARLDCSTELLKYPSDGATANPFMFDEFLGALRLRRWGFVPAARPIGFLTHHLQHDEIAWRQLSTLVKSLAQHPAVRFILPKQLIP